MYEFNDLVGEILLKAKILIIYKYFFPYLGIHPSELIKSIQ
jgi:hypothetical protein